MSRHAPVPLDVALRARWRSFVPEADELCDELIARWGAPERHYHDLRHLEESLTALDLLGGGGAEHLAVWFHDAVYGLGAGADERASADLAAERLSAIPHTRADVGEVVRLVLVTEHHAPRSGDDAGARVSDCDMAILAAEPDRYDESVRGIRAEYARYDDEAFRRGRLAVLDDFLARPRIFHTDHGYRCWEQPARSNVAREVRARRRVP